MKTQIHIGPLATSVRMFAGMPDFADAIETLACEPLDSAWAGASRAETVQRARAGDVSRVAPSDALLSKIETSLDLSSLARASVPAVAGGVPVVPAFLAGSPVAMRARRKVTSPRGEVALFVSQFVSHQVKADTIARRGAAVLALARALAMVRPVALYAYTASRSRDRPIASLTLVRLDSAPLDLARAAWMLSAPEALRQGAVKLHKDMQGKAWTNGTPIEDHDTPRAIADLLGVESYVATPDLFSTSGDFSSDESALAWVQSNLALHTA
jgi:hypothetical protein